MNKKIFLSTNVDPYWNQMIEKKLFDSVSKDEMILFLYVNEPCVVIGRNQNPWQEVSLDCLEANNVKLLRRISGGGTVYHDLGNLNYCIIVDRNTYKEEQAYEMVFQALAPLGIQAE
jgi:lipoate-protein ligase A